MSDVPVPKAAQFSLAGAAFFALVAIGFFGFIFFWDSSQKVTQTPLGELPVSQVVVQSTTTKVKSDAPSGDIESISRVPHQQADPKDENAEAKIQILNSLNQ